MDGDGCGGVEEIVGVRAAAMLGASNSGKVPPTAVPSRMPRDERAGVNNLGRDRREQHGRRATTPKRARTVADRSENGAGIAGW